MNIEHKTINPSSRNSSEKDSTSDDSPDSPPDDPIESEIEVNASGIITYIVDGDTCDMEDLGRIRLADINAPESSEEGYQEAKDYLSSLIYEEFVFLDIDDVYEKDHYDRYVGIIYVRYNDTHVLNVNKALLDNGYAIIWDFDNEFNPFTWKLYYPYEI
ncbi:MAG: thermonuclease family protein [Promethearchaeota archaeon]